MELVIDSDVTADKVVVTDRRPAGFVPLGVREGFAGNDLDAYVEVLDDRTVYFVPLLADGSRYVVTYRMKATTEGAFTALPATVTAVQAPEIKAESDAVRFPRCWNNGRPGGRTLGHVSFCSKDPNIPRP